MGRNAFLDPVTFRLTCHGFVATNSPGEVKVAVSEDFDLRPQDGWKWNGDSPPTFTSFPFPAPPDRKADAKTKLAKIGDKDIRDTIQAVLDLIS